MACTVVICEPLCFLSNNFDKLTISQLKPIVANFHQDEEVIEAKEILLKDVSRAAQDDGGSDLPRLPRRQGDNKGRQSVDDLLKLFTTVDERKLTGALPRYVAENLTRVPFVNADSVNVLTMAKNIEGLEHSAYSESVRRRRVSGGTGRARPVRPDAGPKRRVVDRSTSRSQNDVNLHDFPLHDVASRGPSA